MRPGKKALKQTHLEVVTKVSRSWKALSRISHVFALVGLWEYFCATFYGFRTRWCLKVSSAWRWWYDGTTPKGWGAPTTSLSLVRSLLLLLSAKEVLEIFPLGPYFNLRSNIEQNLGRCLWWWGGGEKGQTPKNSYIGSLFAWSKSRLWARAGKGSPALGKIMRRARRALCLLFVGK